MEDKWQQEGQTGKISKKAVFNLFKYLIRHDPLKLFNPIGIKADISRISGLYAKLPDWRDPFAKFFHTNELAYFETIAQFENKKNRFEPKIHLCAASQSTRDVHFGAGWPVPRSSTGH